MTPVKITFFTNACIDDSLIDYLQRRALKDITFIQPAGVQNGLYQRCRVIKKREEDYAKKIPRTALKELNSDAIKQLRRCVAIRELKDDYFNDKDYGLNITALTTHKTLEFRLFNGSIQSRRIKKYVRWCLEFCINNG